MLLCAAVLLFMAVSKADFKRVLPPSLCLGTGLFFGVIAALTAVISTDFTKYFIMFPPHFSFNNDLWILDPATDMLINIVPEGFFHGYSRPDRLYLWQPVPDPVCRLPDPDY